MLGRKKDKVEEVDPEYISRPPRAPASRDRKAQAPVAQPTQAAQTNDSPSGLAHDVMDIINEQEDPVLFLDMFNTVHNRLTLRNFGNNPK